MDEVVEAVQRLLEKRGRYLLAVSGGVDSMALLHCCASLQEESEFVLHVVHINHGLRTESEVEANFVETTARQLSLPVTVVNLPPRPERENLEHWARHERYKHYHRLLDEYRLSSVVTAHHQDDLVETFLMRILSNKEPRALLEKNEALRVLRPLLSLTKDRLREYAERNSIKFTEDSSNRDIDFLRNRIRHLLVPFLREHFGESVTTNVKNQALALEQELRALHMVAEQEAQRLAELEFGSRAWLAMLREILLASPTALSWKVVRKIFLPYSGAPLGRASCGRLVDFFLRGDVALQLPGGLEVRRKSGGIEVKRAP